MESRVWSGVSSLYQADLVQAVRQSADPEVACDWSSLHLPSTYYTTITTPVVVVAQ